jgi:hypothetical protein
MDWRNVSERGIEEHTEIYEESPKAGEFQNLLIHFLRPIFSPLSPHCLDCNFGIFFLSLLLPLPSAMAKVDKRCFPIKPPTQREERHEAENINL